MKLQTKHILSKMISPAVVMLLERMETNPEEFTKNYATGPVYPSHKWDGVVSKDTMKEVFTPLERLLIKRKLRKLRKEAVEQNIMKNIIDPQDESFYANQAGTTVAGLAQSMRRTKEQVIQQLMEKKFQQPDSSKSGGLAAIKREGDPYDASQTFGRTKPSDPYGY